MTEAAATFERIKPRPAYELVAEAIERKILAGRLRPGDPVGTESELVRQFGVNRSTVREGIRLLEQSGLVARETEPAPVGGRAALPSPRHAHEPRADPAAGDVPRAVAHVARARAGLPSTRPWTTPPRRISPSWRPTSTRRARCRHDPAAVAELDAEFHKLIGKAAHNRVLLLAKEPSGMLVRPVTALIIVNNPRGIPRLIEAHGNILEALQRRDREQGPPVGRPPPARLEGRLRALRPGPRQARRAALTRRGIGAAATASRRWRQRHGPHCGISALSGLGRTWSTHDQDTRLASLRLVVRMITSARRVRLEQSRCERSRRSAPALAPCATSASAGAAACAPAAVARRGRFAELAGDGLDAGDGETSAFSQMRARRLRHHLVDLGGRAPRG